MSILWGQALAKELDMHDIIKMAGTISWQELYIRSGVSFNKSGHLDRDTGKILRARGSCEAWTEKGECCMSDERCLAGERRSGLVQDWDSTDKMIVDECFNALNEVIERLVSEGKTDRVKWMTVRNLWKKNIRGV